MSLRPDRKPARPRPSWARVEALESRVLLSAAAYNPYLVTTSEGSGIGSLGRAIADADALSGSTPITISFDLPTTDPGYDPASGTWMISIASALPAITRPGVTIDGTTQPASTPSAILEAGGTVGVGVGNTTLTMPRAPTVQIVGPGPGGGLSIGLDVEASSTTIVGLSIDGFGGAGDGLSANILVDRASGTVIEGDVVGSSASGTAVPSAAAVEGIRAVGSGSGIVQGCLIGSSSGRGVELGIGSDGWLIRGNVIQGNGLGSSNRGGVDIGAGSGDEAITGNQIDANWGGGIDSYSSFGGNQIVGNTIADNGIGTLPGEVTPGIRLGGAGNLVESNIIDANYGAGVLVTPESIENLIIRNSILGNGTIPNLDGDGPTGELGIDILTPTDNLSQGTSPYETLNTPDPSRDGVNGPANFPVLTDVRIENGQLTFSGFARPGASIELYLGDASSNGFGQGRIDLGTFIEGSSADLDSGTGSYGPTLDGVAVGSDATNRFTFSIPTPEGVAPGSYVTATASEDGLTSEFGPLAQVVGVGGPLTYQPMGSGPDAITLQADDSDVEIQDNGTVVAREPLSLATSIQLDGTPGAIDSLGVDASGSFAERLSIAGFTSTSILVGGDFSGQISAPTSLTIQSVAIGGSLAPDASITAGSFVAGVGQSLPAVRIGGDLAGTVDAVEDLDVPGSGVLGSIVVDGNLLSTGQVLAGSIGSIAVERGLFGLVQARGAGTIGTVDVGGDLSGTVSAPPDSSPGSGSIGTVSVGGSLSGTVGSGSISSVAVGGNLSGSVSAPETTAGTGVISGVSVTGTLSGTVSSGSISGVTVGGDLSGTVIAEGAGRMGSVLVEGNLTSTGKLEALHDNADATSGVLESVAVTGSVLGLIEADLLLGSATVNTVGSAGSIEAGDVSNSLDVTNSDGVIAVQSLSGNLTVSNVQASSSIDVAWITSTGSFSAATSEGVIAIGTVQGSVSLGSAGTVEYASIAPGAVISATSITSLTIDDDVAGTIDIAGNLQALQVGGSVDAGALIEANRLEMATVGMNMAGQVIIAGTLGSLAVGGATPGSVVAEHVGTISALAGTGPIVLQVEEDGVRRLLEATSTGAALPEPTQTASGPSAIISFHYLYESDSGALSSPQLTVQVANLSGSTAPDQFDLSLVVYGDIAQFNLARLDAVGVSGVRNVSVEGDVLTTTQTQASIDAFNDTNPPGVYLPLDHLAGVEVRDFIPSDAIEAASIQAVAAGLIGQSNGSTVQGAGASQSDAQNLLVPGTWIIPASDTFLVPFDDNPSNHVGFFLDDTTAGGFDPNNIAFAVQSVVEANAAGTANNPAQPSNLARGSDVAAIRVAPLPGSLGSQVQEIDILGDEHSISTRGWIDGAINSTGPLGDLSLMTSRPIGNITAASFFGNIATNGTIVGTILTTGLDTDPISGLVSIVPADFGRVYANTSDAPTTTTLTSNGGPFDGQIIVHGNLLTTVTINGGFGGLIAAQGNIGAAYSLSRLGGLTVNGSDNGVILALGEILGDVTINGGLHQTAVIAAGGGILGNTTIHGGMGFHSAIVSGGAIGSPIYGTTLTVNGASNGLIASVGNLSLSANQPNPSHVFSDLDGTVSAQAIDAIFSITTTGTGSAEMSELLEWLEEILVDLAELYINGKTLAD